MIFLTILVIAAGCSASATPTTKDTGRGLQATVSTTTVAKVISPVSASVTPAKPTILVPTASLTLGPGPSPTEIVYTVEAGDSVSKIAAKYGTTTQAIVTANKLDNPNVIHVGQKLVIPPQPTATPVILPMASPAVTTTKTAP
ncbi:MAG: LysM peptidoglycan-binding domain-containing protein [Chloroflexi bacterium]|nr:LysM peptidoglycan-binding domain-containing protein [Chloroflexota bacterium]